MKRSCPVSQIYIASTILRKIKIASCTKIENNHYRITKIPNYQSKYWKRRTVLEVSYFLVSNILHYTESNQYATI
jgi:hypothetical protein